MYLEYAPNKTIILQYWKYMKPRLQEEGKNPVQWAQAMMLETTPCDLIFFMALRDLTDVSCIQKN